MTAPQNGSAKHEREPAYFCMHCTETFATADESNEHHKATGHHQHWLRERGYEARQQRKAKGQADVVAHPDTFMALQTALRANMLAVAQSCRPHGETGRAHDVQASPELIAAMTAVRAELRGLPPIGAQELAERFHNLCSRAAVALGHAAQAATFMDLPAEHRRVIVVACELLLKGES